MLRRLTVNNYQSLHAVSLELGPFTVVVGPSSSGKSALVRAVKHLVSNSRGSSYVTHGKKTSTVSAEVVNASHDSTAYRVALTRGEGVGKYELYVHQEQPGDPEWGFSKDFTKLGGTVPAEVTEALGIQPGAALNFAGQFDRPYLLDSSPAEVARNLGQLTNVSTVFAAAREAARRQREAQSELRTREADLAALVHQAQSFKDLRTRVAAQEDLESRLEDLVKRETQLERFTSLSSDLSVSETALRQASVEVSRSEPPKLDAVYALRGRSSSLQGLMAAWVRGSREAKEAALEEAQVTEALEAVQVKRHGVLHSAGTCPTCHQSTRELDHV